MVALSALVGAGFDVAHVVTRPDTRRGRGSSHSPSPVKAAAGELGLAVGHDVDELLAVGAEVGVVVAYGRIIRPSVLARLPMVNLHFSLLPRWRGAAPVERAILAGDTVTGVDVMAVEEGLDTGPVYAEATVPIDADITADALRAELADVGARLLVETMRTGLTDPVPQTGEVTYADKIDPAELELDWRRSAVELHRLVRVGGAWTTFRGDRLKIWRSARRGHDAGIEVTTGDGSIVLLEVQPAGRARMSALAWANGARPAPGELGLGSS